MDAAADRSPAPWQLALARLEGALPDATANRIIEEDIVPQFRRGDYAGGIATGVDRMLRVIEGEPLPLEQDLAAGLAPAARLDVAR